MQRSITTAPSESRSPPQDCNIAGCAGGGVRAAAGKRDTAQYNLSTKFAGIQATRRPHARCCSRLRPSARGAHLSGLDPIERRSKNAHLQPADQWCGWTDYCRQTVALRPAGWRQPPRRRRCRLGTANPAPLPPVLAVPGDRVSASQIVADLSKAVAQATGKPEGVGRLLQLPPPLPPWPAVPVSPAWHCCPGPSCSM